MTQRPLRYYSFGIVKASIDLTKMANVDYDVKKCDVSYSEGNGVR